MKPFRERNHTAIGLVGLLVIAVAVLGAFRADRLPIIGGGTTYHAEFAEIGALEAGDEVRIAGVSVGKVDDVELRGDRVRVTFRITSGDRFGTTSGAAIKIRTLLGASYLAVEPDGPGVMAEGDTIPVDRTTAPYDVVQAFSDLSETTDELDTDQIAAALTTLSEVAAETPVEFREAIAGVSDLSANLAARDAEIQTLLTNLRRVTGVLADRSTELEALFSDSSELFAAITARRDSIHALLVATQEVSTELSALADDTRGELQPALEKLGRVTDVLVRNQASLDELLRVSPTFYRLFSQALGVGPWFDVYLGGIPPNLGLGDQLREAIAGATGGAG